MRMLALLCLLVVVANPVRGAGQESAAPEGAARDSGDLRIAVASNFSRPLLQLLLVYAAETGENAVASSASTGVLFTQIRHGAPFDLFLAADSERPALLEQSGDAVAGSRVTYAHGLLVLAYREGIAPESPTGIGTLLARPGLTLAMANPDLAPYGRAAREVLGRFPASPRILTGANANQALQMWASGGADAALVPASFQPSHFLAVPEDWYTPIEQQAVILSASDKQERARAFLDWLTGPVGRQRVASFGYGLRDD